MDGTALAYYDDKVWIAQACIAFNDDNVNAPERINGSTPLHLACMHSHVDAVKLLMESGAQPSLYLKDDFGSIPIDGAIHGGRVDTVKLLLSYHEEDKEMALENLGNAFVMVAQKQNLEMVKLFLGVCPDIIHSRSADDERTALHRSCLHSDDTEVMEFLLTLGAGVNVVDDYGQTPLFTAASWGRPECAKVLLAAGANVNHRVLGGITPLDTALLQVNLYTKTEAEAGGRTENPLDIALVQLYTEAETAEREMVKVIEAAGGITGAQMPDE